MNHDMESGHAVAKMCLPLIKVSAENAEDQVLWWAGFLACIAGYAGANIGAPALGVIGESMCKGVAAELSTRAN